MTQAFKIIFPAAYAVEFEPQGTIPVPGDDEFVLETRYSLISPGTELALYMGTHIGLNDPGNSWAKYPFSPGYAAVGRIIPQGGRVPQTNPELLYFASTPHQTYSRAATNSGQFLLAVPEGLAPEHAIFCRLAAIAATAIAVAPVLPGERVAVLGAGLIGNLAAQRYQVAGAHVAVVETNEARQHIARQCGLTAVAGGNNVSERLKTALEGEPDVVIEATGVAALVNGALDMVRRRGRVVLLGSPRGMTEINAYRHIHARGVTMTGAHEGLQGTDGLPSRRELTENSLALIARDELKVAPLLTQVLPASSIQEAYEMLIHQQDKALGIVLDWQSIKERY
ncbi:putative zinc-type alcohol dehydrogenase-like protein YdjJ [Abditibacteriota bacterium]|nr:putative zinc-type alcohol dehydrogenase-like protein YdjJ [Abditibacteriota bacterium]